MRKEILFGGLRSVEAPIVTKNWCTNLILRRCYLQVSYLGVGICEYVMSTVYV